MIRAPLTGVVTLGTDYHRFERLIDWLERWDVRHPGVVAWSVQHGSTRPMSGANNFDLMAPEELLTLLQAADIVVTQGGPGSIRDSRTCGKIPIVVPRLARFREAVDDHQVAFTERFARDGLLIIARTESEFTDVLDRAVSEPAQLRATDDERDLSETIDRFGFAVGRLLVQKPARAQRRGKPRRELSPPPPSLS